MIISCTKTRPYYFHLLCFRFDEDCKPILGGVDVDYPDLSGVQGHDLCGVQSHDLSEVQVPDLSDILTHLDTDILM